MPLILIEPSDIGSIVEAWSAKLDAFSALADAAGWLHSNGSGVYVWSAPSASDITGLGTAATHAATDFDAAGSAAAITAASLGLGSVENTALSTWGGTANLITLGTITTGTWHGSPIAAAYVGDLSSVYQPLDAELSAIAGLVSVADKLPYFTGSATAALATLTAAARTFLAAVDAAAERTALGLGTAATKDTGIAAGNVVVLDGSAKLPAVDGSQLTGISGGGDFLPISGGELTGGLIFQDGSLQDDGNGGFSSINWNINGATGGVSFDGGEFTSDGFGTIYLSEVFGGWWSIDSLGRCSFDGGLITSDGYGNVSVVSILSILGIPLPVTITGSHATGEAFGNLLDFLVSIGFITDSTSV